MTKRSSSRRLSLATQIVGLLLCVLGLAIAVNGFLIAGEASLAARLAIRSQRIDRLASAAEFLRDEGQSDPRAVRALSTPTFLVWTSETAFAAPDLHDSGFVKALASRLAESEIETPVYSRTVRPTEAQLSRLRRLGRGEFRRRLDAGRRDADEPRLKKRDAPPPLEPPFPDRPMRGPDEDDRRLEVEIVSFQVTDGVWLNAAMRMPTRRRLTGRALASLSVVFLSVGVAGVVIAGRIARPLDRLADAADRFGRGDDTPLTDIEGPKEIARTLEAFEAMRERLARLISDQRRVLGAIGHDLRTPLAGLRIRLENLDDSPDKERMIAVVEDMGRMTEEILSWSRHVGAGEETVEIDLPALLQEICADYAAMDADVRWRPAAAPPVRFEGKPTALRRAVRNLVDNAVRYGERATISLVASDGAISILVEDEGPGLPEADLQAMFEPFRRGDASRNRETGGVGLGLAVVSSVAAAHGGQARLEARPERGLRAIIELPVGRADVPTP